MKAAMVLVVIAIGIITINNFLLLSHMNENRMAIIRADQDREADYQGAIQDEIGVWVVDKNGSMTRMGGWNP